VCFLALWPTLLTLFSSFSSTLRNRDFGNTSWGAVIRNALVGGPIIRSPLIGSVTLQWIKSLESLTTSWTSRSSPSKETKRLWKCENASTFEIWGERNSRSYKKMFDPSLDHKIAPFKLLLVEGVEEYLEIKDVEAKAIVKIEGVDGAITLEQEASLSNN